MSPPNGLELDFGFSSLLDGSATGAGTSGNNLMNTNSNFASSLSDYGNNNTGNGNGAADYLSLSNLFDSHSNNGLGNAMSTVNAGAAASWQAKKSFLDQQQQQLQQEQNSLNALLSQHSSNTNGNGQASAAHSNVHVNVGTSQGASGNPFGFATREELEALASSANANSVQQNNNTNAVTAAAAAAGNNGNNNYMFVATIVDPNQEDAQPQQMLFLPGSNQVIPMPSNAAAQAAAAANGSGVPSMMALANLPVVFPQGGASNNNSKRNATANFSLSLPSSADVTGNTTNPSNWQQPQGFFGNLSNGFSSGLANLEDAFSAHTQALTPSTMDFASSQGHQQTALVPSPMAAANSNSNNAANNTKAVMPVRPLSAYNFFFSDERERILHNKTEEDDVFDNNKKQRLLLAHLAKDRSKRRPHRKTHGKINFTTLSKLIGQRWKQLPDERKNFYREVAAIDLERYQRELRERSPSSGGPNGNADF